MEKVTDTQTTACPDLGSDHQALRARLRFTTLSSKKQTARKEMMQATKSLPKSPYNYEQHLTKKLTDPILTHDLDERSRQIEEALIEATRLSQTDQTTHTDTQYQHNTVTELMKKDNQSTTTPKTQNRRHRLSE